MKYPPDAQLAAEFEALISAGEDNENAVQAFIERHTAFLPTPNLLNHQLHLQSIISKFPIGDRKTDFAYLTKSSDRWRIVFVELESPAKTLFKVSPNAANSADFNGALAQVQSWREHWDDYKSDVVRRLQPLLVPVPMARNAIQLECLLIIGRAAEKRHSDERRRRLASIAEQGIHVMTYDTLLDNYRAGRGRPKALLTVNQKGYRLKAVEQLPELMFAYVEPQHLAISRQAEAALRADGYAIDAWRSGSFLSVNGKHALMGTDDITREAVDDVMSHALASMRRNLAAQASKRRRA